MKPNTVGRVDDNDRQAGQFSAFATLDTGLLQGAKLLTLNGETPVELLGIGDHVITRGSGIARVQHIQRSTRKVHGIAITTGSLGDTRPENDVILAGDQVVLVRDWRARALFSSERALAAARTLVDGECVTDLGLIEATIFQIFCDAPHILYADGLELGTADAACVRGAAQKAQHTIPDMPQLDQPAASTSTCWHPLAGIEAERRLPNE